MSNDNEKTEQRRSPLSPHFLSFKKKKLKRKLGDPTCLAHLRAAHEASGSLSAFGFPGFTELGPLPWKRAPDDSYEACLREMRTSFGGALQLLLSQSGLRPGDIDILVTNSSIFAPTPSLSSMLVNDFKLKPSVSTLSVAGMGCSFGVLGIGALRDLMRGHEKARRGRTVNAVFVTGECITAGFYLGKDPMMLASTSLVRQGAAAVWLSTKSSFSLEGGEGNEKGGEKAEGRRPFSKKNKRTVVRAKYRLQHFVKTHNGADDVAYGSMGMRSDGHTSRRKGGDGGGDEQQQQPERRAMYFSGDIPRVASRAIDAVLRGVAPRLLSPRQLVQALLRMRREKRQKREEEKRQKEEDKEDEERKEGNGVPTPRRRRRAPRSPSSSSSSSPGFSFASCCDHFALHPGVHSMLVAFMKGMRLPVSKAMPSFAALRDYGNLGSASTWYVLANLEAVGAGIRRGERVLQLGVGSGVKAGACVWKALRAIRSVDHAAWRHLNGIPVEERDLPLAVPDVLAQEAAKAAAGGESGNDALDAATALVSQAERLVPAAAEERAGAPRGAARSRRHALPEVRAEARERAAALARELDELHLARRREAGEEEKAARQLLRSDDREAAAAAAKES